MLIVQRQINKIFRLLEHPDCTKIFFFKDNQSFPVIFLVKP